MTNEKKEILNSDTEYYYTNELECNKEKKVSYIDTLEQWYLEAHGDWVTGLAQSHFHSTQDNMLRKAQSQISSFKSESRTAYFEKDKVKPINALLPKNISLTVVLPRSLGGQKLFYAYRTFKELKSFVKQLKRQAKTSFKDYNLTVTVKGFKKDIDFNKLVQD